MIATIIHTQALLRRQMALRCARVEAEVQAADVPTPVFPTQPEAHAS